MLKRTAVMKFSLIREREVTTEEVTQTKAITRKEKLKISTNKRSPQAVKW